VITHTLEGIEQTALYLHRALPGPRCAVILISATMEGGRYHPSGMQNLMVGLAAARRLSNGIFLILENHAFAVEPLSRLVKGYRLVPVPYGSPQEHP
jgi:hypothetical protein